MRKIVVTLCFGLFTVLSYAQQPIFWECHSQEECVVLADSLLSLGKRAYEHDSLLFPEQKRGTRGGHDIYYFSEKNPADAPRKFIVAFTFYMEGENQSLEIEGTPTYRLSLLQGPYLDLFPIWQQYIKPEADINLVVADKKDWAKIVTDNPNALIRFFLEEQSGGYWKIYR